MEFLKKSIHMDQIGCEEQTQITLEDDVNIADAKPDVYQVVTQQGHVELEEVRASDGHVHVKGVLHFKVLYLADEETHHPACMEGELAFEEQILMGSVSGTDQVQAQAILEDLSVGMINSRKLSVQALLQIRLFTERMKQLDVAVGLDGTEQIEVKKKDLQAKAGISWASVTKLSKGETVSMEVLMKVCKTLGCDIGDIMELIPTEEDTV